MKNAAIVIVMLAVIGGGALALSKNSNNNQKPTTGSQSASEPSKQPTDTQTPSDQNTESTIVYSDSGFSPGTLTVKSGTAVTVKNESSNTLQFDSDPHPAHTDNEELNIETVSPGSSQTFTVKRTGTFGYHNHLNLGDTGTIVVE